MITQHTVTVNGMRLAYEVSGPPNGDPLLLLPALGECAGDWAPVREVLDRERRVYAVDLRGHGRSDRPGEYSLELMRDDVLGLLDALGLDRVDLVGHSMGGVVAHLVAQARPWQVVRLVLEDAPRRCRGRRGPRSAPRGSCPSTGRWCSRSAPGSTGRTPPGSRAWGGSRPRPWWWRAARRATYRGRASPNWSAASPAPACTPSLRAT